MVPPERPSCQFGTLSFGGSRCASSVIRFWPATTWNGATSTRRVESQSTLMSARSMFIGYSGARRSMMLPASTPILPVK